MTEAPANKRIVVICITLAALVMAGTAAWSLSNGKLDSKVRQKQRDNLRSPIATGKTTTLGSDRINMPVPDFRFAATTGGSFGLSDLKGKIWVAEFVFTNCAGSCPQMSKMTELLQDRTQDLPDLHFVSFTVDPERDSLLALKEYGAEFNADSSRWHFLRSTKEKVHELGRKGFFLLNDTDALLHSQKVALVDREGRIRGFYDGAGPERVSDFKALEIEIRKMYKAENG